MIFVSDINPAEKGTLTIDCTFQDEEGTATVPISASWSLTDERGDVINSRQDVSISPLDSTVRVILSGDDLAIENNGISRVFTVKFVYDPGDGSQLPSSDELHFDIEERINVDS